jgi:signal transduction histidine kinase
MPQARYKGLEVKTEISADAARWFQGDGHHLRQVLLNLLANAVKFTETGQVLLRVIVVESDAFAREYGSRLRIRVSGSRQENRRLSSNHSHKPTTRLRASMAALGWELRSPVNSLRSWTDRSALRVLSE